MAAEEANLVQLCLQGDAEALRTLVERFQGDVYGLCVRLLGDRHEAEDVAQDVFLRVFRSLKSWDRNRSLRPWVMAIAVNRCRTCLARRGRRPEPVGYLDEAVADGRAGDTNELLREIGLAVEQLRAEYREVFLLFHERGLPYEEIAQAVGRPIGTVKTWLHRARIEVMQRLRERGMAPEVGHELP